MQEIKNYQQIIQQVAKEVNLPEDVVNNAYKGFWLYIKNSIESLPIKQDISDEEFDSLKTSFNIPSLGKLFCTRDKFKNLKKSLNYKKLENA